MDLINNLQLPRPVYEAAVAWAMRSPNSPMWQAGFTISGLQLAKAIETSMQPPVLASE